MNKIRPKSDIFVSITERRPLKPQLPTPLFRSPATLVTQQDSIGDGRGMDAYDLGSIGGNFTNHYQPNRQTVSEQH